MLARLLVYNPDCKVFGYWRATFTWDGSGFIKLRQWLTVGAWGLGTVGSSAYSTTAAPRPRGGCVGAVRAAPSNT